MAPVSSIVAGETSRPSSFVTSIQSYRQGGGGIGSKTIVSEAFPETSKTHSPTPAQAPLHPRSFEPFAGEAWARVNPADTSTAQCPEHSVPPETASVTET